SKKNQGSVFAGIVQHKLRSTSNWHRSVLEQMSAKSEGCNSRRTANHASVLVLLSLTGVSISNLSNSRIRALPRTLRHGLVGTRKTSQTLFKMALSNRRAFLDDSKPE